MTLFHFARVVLIVAFVGGCASLPPGADFPKTHTVALDHPEQTQLGRRSIALAREHGGRSGFHLLPVGIDGFLTRVQMIDAAERTLDVQYFIFRGDDTGQLLTAAMLRAADRGVRVRVLLDDLEMPEDDPQIVALDAHPNIEIRLFNPFSYRGRAKVFRLMNFAFSSSRLDYRMHNKLFVVDDAVALVGGRNVGDEYFQVGSDFRVGDYDLFAAGPVVKDLSASFDDYWNSALAIPIEALENGKPPASALEEYRKALDEHREQMARKDYVRRLASGEPLAGMVSGRLPLVWAPARVIWDSPEKRRVETGEAAGRLMHRSVVDAAAAAQSELLMVSPYFIPGDDGMRLFRDLRKRGVRVRVLTNSLQSAAAEGFWPLMAYAGYQRYRVPLLEAGVELYEVRPVLGKPKGSGDARVSESAGVFGLHAKVIVLDRRRLFIGSMNFDQRSMRINTEMGLIIDSPDLARQSAARFESYVRPANSYELVLRPRDGGASPRILWRTEDNGKSIEYDRELARSPWQRFKADFLSLLPLDGEL